MIQNIEFNIGRDKRLDLNSIITKQNMKFQYSFDHLIRVYLELNYNVDKDKIQEYYIVHGDLAGFLFNLYKNEKENKLTKSLFNFKNNKNNLELEEVIKAKENIIKTIGNNTLNTKVEIFSELINKSTDSIEVLYIARIFLNKLLIGLSEKSIINCLTEIIKDIQFKYDKNETINNEIKNLINFLERDIFKYKIFYDKKIRSTYNIEINQFLAPALCKAENNIDTLIENIKKQNLECLIETKFDGERSNMHYEKNSINLASRNLNLQNDLYYILKNNIEKELKKIKNINNFILDGEIVLFDKERNKFSHFQDLRKKEENTEFYKNKEFYFIAFDILYLNDKDISHLNLENRKLILENYFFKKFKYIVLELGERISLLNQNLQQTRQAIITKFNFAKDLNCEGLIIKSIGKQTEYPFGKRKWHKVII